VPYYAKIEELRDLIAKLDTQYAMNPVVFHLNPATTHALRTLLDGFIGASTIVTVEAALTPETEK
jgi:hypothetical protein